MTGTHVQNGPVAVVAAWREQVVVVLLAVRLAVALKEVSGADLLLAVSAHEVLGVPRPAHGGHHLHIQDMKVFKNVENKSLQLLTQLRLQCTPNTGLYKSQVKLIIPTYIVDQESPGNIDTL